MLDQYLHANLFGHFIDWPEHYFHRAKPMDYLLIWVLAGEGFVHCEGKRIVAKAGDLICLPPRVPHEYGADPRDPWEILWVHFDGQLAETFMNLIRAHGGACVRLGLDVEMRDRWTELAFAQSAIYPGYDILVNTALYALLGSIVFRLRTRQHRAASATPFDVHRLQAYIHRHLTETITLEDLARQLHLSPTHFVRVFKKHLGVSPIYYVIQRRIALACTLLAETRLTVKQISQKVGYEDPYYFSRLFKKVMRTNPTDYRRDTNLPSR